MPISREVQLASRPEGVPKEDNFRLVDVSLPSLNEGEIRVANRFITVDPYMRLRMIDRESYLPPFQLGETLTGGAIGEVVESRHTSFCVGDCVESMLGWRQGYVSNGEGICKIDATLGDLSAFLGVLGMPGLTAYVGLFRIAQLKEGETVFISGAAGAVGSLAGQIAKIKNCYVIGSAGSDEKIVYLKQTCHFDEAFNYNNVDLDSELKIAAPKGLDVYFDNVGGKHLVAALNHMNQFGRVAMCGSIANYNTTQPPEGPNNLFLATTKDLTLRGFIVSNHYDLEAQCRSDVSQWIKDKKIHYQETVYEGIEQAPTAFMGLFSGKNTGKMIVKL